MLLQRLATGATGVKQAREPSEALYAHAQYNTQPVSMNSAEGFALQCFHYCLSALLRVSEHRKFCV